jgi:regulator of cell morphogenesis and NO signaling
MPMITKMGGRTVADLVTEEIQRAEVFKQFGIDFCCGGDRTLAEVCELEHLDLEQVIGALNNPSDRTVIGYMRFDDLELDALCNLIEIKHHTYVKENIPVLTEYVNKVAQVHGEAHPELLDIQYLWRDIANELIDHLSKEELALFPYVRKLVLALKSGDKFTPPPFASIVHPIKMMESEHEFAGSHFHKIAELSDNYTTPDSACNTYKALYSKLEEFQDDLFLHVHLENNILFPKAKKLEEVVIQN